MGLLCNIRLLGVLSLWHNSEESCRSHIDAVVQLIHFQLLILGKLLNTALAALYPLTLVAIAL